LPPIGRIFIFITGVTIQETAEADSGIDNLTPATAVMQPDSSVAGDDFNSGIISGYGKQLFISTGKAFRMSHLQETEKKLHDVEHALARLESRTDQHDEKLRHQIKVLRRLYNIRLSTAYKNLSGWETVQIARHPDRLKFEHILSLIFDDFIELHGDRRFGDDRALIGGFAAIGGQKVMLIGNNKGTTTEDNIERNFGYAQPEGFRKTLRLMQLAERFGLPVVSIIDIPAAYPGKQAEELGVAEAIARNIYEQTRHPLPIISVIIGEGGSGGALASGAVGDAILMLSSAIFSVAPPETCASILFRDASRAPDTAEALKLRAGDLKNLHVIDEVIEEPLKGAHRDHEGTASSIKKSILKHLKRLNWLSAEELLHARFEKYATIGVFQM
jgi:acetyl-CoA carboxylase carboxyl transferase subunit alpha